MTGRSGQIPLAVRLLLIFAVVFVSAAASIEITRGAQQIAPFWPTNAFALVGVLRLRLHEAPIRAYAGIGAACLLANLVCGTPPNAAVWFSIGNVCEVALAHMLLRRAIDAKGLGPVLMVMQRLFIAAVAAPAVGGVIGLIGLGPLDGAEAASLWMHRWMADALAMLVFAPFGLLAGTRRVRRPRAGPGAWRDVGGSLLGVCIVVAGVALAQRLALLSIGVPVTMFAAARLRAPGVALVVGALAVLIVPFVISPAFSPIGEPMTRLVLVQTFLLADGLAGLAIATLLDERDALVETLGAERRAAAAAAERRMRLLTFVGHEIRTPLNAIMGCTELIAAAGPVNQRQRDLCAAASGAAQQLQSLAGELLETARLEHGGPLSPKRIDARAAIEEAVAALRVGSPSAQQAPIEVDASGVVWADPLRFARVVTNLVSNAVKYAAAYGPIEVRARTNGDGARLEVIDRGPGFSTLVGIFEPFAQREAEGDSTGLGLSIVKQLVEAHGGTVTAASVPFVETRLTAVFPAEGAAHSRARTQAEPVHPDDFF